MISGACCRPSRMRRPPNSAPSTRPPPPSPTGTDATGIRDLTGLLWASIDNDDSRDLDQLTVAEPLPGGDVTIRVAVADVDALVERRLRHRRPRPPQHDLGLHRGRDLPDAAREALDRPHVAER